MEWIPADPEVIGDSSLLLLLVNALALEFTRNRVAFKTNANQLPAHFGHTLRTSL
jgi:hypothetical protein